MVRSNDELFFYLSLLQPAAALVSTKSRGYSSQSYNFIRKKRLLTPIFDPGGMTRTDVLPSLFIIVVVEIREKEEENRRNADTNNGTLCLFLRSFFLSEVINKGVILSLQF